MHEELIMKGRSLTKNKLYVFLLCRGLYASLARIGIEQFIQIISTCTERYINQYIGLLNLILRYNDNNENGVLV